MGFSLYALQEEALSPPLVYSTAVQTKPALLRTQPVPHKADGAIFLECEFDQVASLLRALQPFQLRSSDSH